MNLTSADRYKPTDLYRSMVDAKKITASSDHEEHMYIPNHQSSSSTWDAKHLDKFIRNSPWASSTGSIKPVKYDNRQNSAKLVSQKSHFFKTGPRFSPYREKEYIDHNFHNFEYKDSRLGTNALISLRAPDQTLLEKHYSVNFLPKEPSFDKSKLEFSTQANELMTPKQRREQVHEIAKEQKKFKEWKETMKEISKKHRVYKGEYKHGILGLDNPLNSETLIYKPEHEVITNYYKETGNIESKRGERLSSWVKTNQIIEFHNKNFNKATVEPPKVIVPGNSKIKVENNYTKDWKDTHHRIFVSTGDQASKYSIERAQELKKQESKGRNWDIISWKNTEIPLKKSDS